MSVDTHDRPAVLDRDAELRLLLIEDSTSDTELVLALLEDGLPRTQVNVVANLADALVELDRHRYDVALADLSLPDADGAAVVSAVRAAHPETALLVHTSRVDRRLALWALAEGAQDYLVKGEQDGSHLASSLLHALQRQRVDEETVRYLQLARGLLDALEAPTCAIAPDGTIIAINAAWRQLIAVRGGSAGEVAEGQTYLSVCPSVTDGDLAVVAEIAEGLDDVLSGHAARFQLEYPCGEPVEGQRWFSVRIGPTDIDGARGAVVSHVDVTAMREIQDKLSHQALHDPLTGLPNRMLLGDRIEQAIVDVRRRNAQVGIAFVDLDHFKRVNDSLGHAAGDDLLELVAERLRLALRAGDTIARYSGDEFVVVWRDLSSREDLMVLVQRLLDALVEPFALGTTTVIVSASIGIALGDGSQTAEELLADADVAMYDAKSHARGRSRVFTETMRRNAHDRINTEAELRLALVRSELVLHYQPVVDLVTGRIVGVEALARWQHPVRGLLAPGEFIPIAESSGIIVALGRWVLAQACIDAAAFVGAAAGIDVAVNLSTRQLTQPEVIDDVRDALRVSGLDPARLVLEVTESALMEDEEAAAAALGELSAIGVRVAIDDFGTGYSSLLYLRRYSVQALKLDRAFVSGIGISDDDDAICRSVIALAKDVGVTSIAEGVETMEQFAALRANGCTQAQGFLWSKAVPLEDLAGTVERCEQMPAPPTVRGRRRRKLREAIDVSMSDRIGALYAEGTSLHTIAAILNREAGVSPSGRRWTATSVALHFSAGRTGLDGTTG